VYNLTIDSFLGSSYCISAGLNGLRYCYSYFGAVMKRLALDEEAISGVCLTLAVLDTSFKNMVIYSC
jgi:hypothetical protein